MSTEGKRIIYSELSSILLLCGTVGELSKISYPLPLPLLGQKDDHQLGMHLVSVLTEWQVPAFKGNIDQVPVGERKEQDEH